MTRRIQNQLKTGWRYRELLGSLVSRDLKLKYRRSMLGYLWSLLNPLLMMAVMTFLFSHLFRFDIPNYPIYLLSGQIMFAFFSEATTVAMRSVIDNGALLKKVYVPKYIFTLSKILSVFVNFAFSLLAIVIVMVVTNTPVTAMLLLTPLPLFYILLFATGVGLILAALAVYYRDILHLYGVFLTAWTYLTPIFYPITVIPQNVQMVIGFNPMYHFISLFRTLVLHGQMPTLTENLVCLTYAAGALIVGLFVYHKLQDNFILYI